MADKKKKNVFVRIFKYLRECVGELKKITWPTVSQTTKNFAIVLLVILIVGLFIYGLDRGLYALLDLIDIKDATSVSTEYDYSSVTEAISSTVDEVTSAVTNG